MELFYIKASPPHSMVRLINNWLYVMIFGAIMSLGWALWQSIAFRYLFGACAFGSVFYAWCTWHWELHNGQVKSNEEGAS